MRSLTKPRCRAIQVRSQMQVLTEGDKGQLEMVQMDRRSWTQALGLRQGSSLVSPE